MIKEKIISNFISSIFSIFFISTNLLLLNVFRNIEYKNVEIEGANFLSEKDLVKNSSLRFPLKLIEIKTKLVEKELRKNLSFQNIAVTRQIYPLRLKIFIQTRNPIALAEIIDNETKIEGFVDINGVFIRKRFLPKEKIKILPVKVIGWKTEYQIYISKILKTYMRNNEELEIIDISPEGFIVLRDKNLKKILLGSEPKNLDLQLKLILDIKKKLKTGNPSKQLRNLDLTDPLKPKAKVFIP